MPTRAAILARAFGRIGLSDYEFSVSPDERAMARDALDSMMAEWEGSGVLLGYVPADDDNDAVLMTTPDYAISAIIDNLASRIAPDFGKTPGVGLSRSAKRGYDLCVSKTLVVPTDARAPKRIYGGGDRYYRFWRY